MKRIVIIILLFAVFAVVFLWPRSQKISFIAFGSVPFSVSADNRSKLFFHYDMNAVLKELGRLESIYSKHLPGSELSVLNKTAHEKFIQVSKEMRGVISTAKHWSGLSDGAFDPTVGPIIDFWKTAYGNKIIPIEDDVVIVRDKIGMDKVLINSSGIKFSRPTISLDLGGVAKGNIVDIIAGLLKMRGVRSGLVDGGGDICIFGSRRFKIAMTNPKTENVIAILDCPSGGVVTSGNYARNFSISGRKFSHIINPKTGWPLESEYFSVTAIAPSAEDADAFATSLMVLGEIGGRKLLSKLGRGYGAVFMHEDGEEVVVDSFLQKTRCQITQ